MYLPRVNINFGFNGINIVEHGTHPIFRQIYHVTIKNIEDEVVLNFTCVIYLPKTIVENINGC